MTFPIAVLLLLTLASCFRDASIRNVDEVLIARTGETPAIRAGRFQQLLEGLRDDRSGEHARLLAYAFARMADYYRANRDDALLEAADRVSAGGEFTKGLCDFYQGVLALPEARQRYGARGVESLRRCVGVSLSERELARVGAGVRGAE